MAKAFAERRFGADAVIEAGGLRPQTAADARDAIETLQFDFGIDASTHQPKGLDSVDLEAFTDIVAMDKNIASALRLATEREIIVWDVHDPWGDDPIQYKRCALKIKQLVADL
jgi:protein-tyrosine-phosphatase